MYMCVSVFAKAKTGNWGQLGAEFMEGRFVPVCPRFPDTTGNQFLGTPGSSVCVPGLFIEEERMSLQVKVTYSKLHSSWGQIAVTRTCAAHTWHLFSRLTSTTALSLAVPVQGQCLGT